MKKVKIDKKKSKHSSVIAVIIVIGIVSASIAFFYYQSSILTTEPQWITSGPFSINKSQYKLSEIVFMNVNNLQPSEAGTIQIIDPQGSTFENIPFNGTLKSSFTYYFKPNTARYLKLCTPQELVGSWGLIFKGVSYKPIKFEVTNEWIPGGQAEIKPIDPC